MQLPYQDRAEAGRALAAELLLRKLENVVVLALCRGGLPVGAEIAAALNAPLDIVVVRKLGVPWQPELAMGAICGSTRVLDSDEIAALHIHQSQIDEISAIEAREMERREKLYRSGRPALEVRGKTAILVDDGLATGASMVAAARHIKSLHPAKLVCAVPVGSALAHERLAQEADECACLACPEVFFAVGYWYLNFGQVTDADVQDILSRFASPAKT